MPVPSFNTTEEAIEFAINHGMTYEESTLMVKKVQECTHRIPYSLEIAIFSAMWNEHCSYKSSKVWLETMHTDAPWVIQGPGENAGVIHIGDEHALVFKVESHNHPSFIEPYQGAGTGVGGILRDVFTMGARPIALMNTLCFGDLANKKNRYLLSSAIAGIGGYGNSFGVPTVGGQVIIDKSYNNNCLVNAFAAGLANRDNIYYSEPSVNNKEMLVAYLGAATGRDGLGGATMASGDFSQEKENQRPTVQVGDPFYGRKLMEACMEIMHKGLIVAIQDMGAAGLTCASVEIASKGKVGVILDLDKVPCREINMSPYDMMLSESQERMLLIVTPDNIDAVRSIASYHALDFAVIGNINTSGDTIDIMFNDEKHASIPVSLLTDDAPRYTCEYSIVSSDNAEGRQLNATYDNIADLLTKVISSPEKSSRRWVWEQYDHTILSRTILPPGGNAGVIRIADTQKCISMTSGVCPYYCAADPVIGGMQAVAETYRNLISTGAQPLAVTDCLNFGNPNNKISMGQFVGCVQGISRSCREMNYPVVSGNVSLYNQTSGEIPILPTPVICGVGLVDDVSRVLTHVIKETGNVLILFGKTNGHLVSSLLMSILDDANNNGSPPIVDPQMEVATGQLILNLNAGNLLLSCTDLGRGGLAAAISRMVIAGNIGAKIEQPVDEKYLQPIEWFFGEDQSRYLCEVHAGNVDEIVEISRAAGVHARKIGYTGGDKLILDNSSISISCLTDAFENYLPYIMGK